MRHQPRQNHLHLLTGRIGPIQRIRAPLEAWRTTTMLHRCCPRHHDGASWWVRPEPGWHRSPVRLGRRTGAGRARGTGTRQLGGQPLRGPEDQHKPFSPRYFRSGAYRGALVSHWPRGHQHGAPAGRAPGRAMRWNRRGRPRPCPARLELPPGGPAGMILAQGRSQGRLIRASPAHLIDGGVQFRPAARRPDARGLVEPSRVPRTRRSACSRKACSSR